MDPCQKLLFFSLSSHLQFRARYLHSLKSSCLECRALKSFLDIEQIAQRDLDWDVE